MSCYEDFDLDIALSEGRAPQRSPLDAIINHSALAAKYRSVRLAETGVMTNSAGRKLNFARFVFRGKKDIIERMEFLSDDKTFRTIDGIVVYKGTEPMKTAYFKAPANTDEVLHDIAGQTKLGESAFLGGLSTFLSLFLSLMTLLFLGKWIFEKIVASRDEMKAKVDSEVRLNAFLFKGQNGKEAAFGSYSTIVSYIHNMIEGKSRGVILYGMPGTGKTYIVRRTLHFAGLQPEQDYAIVKGSSASVSDNIKIIYSTLYEYNGKIIVFDDFDSALSDINVINLLKAALDSYPVRIVSMPDLGQYSSNKQPLPSRFEFTGKIIMITNKEKIDTALLSRTQAVALNFSSKQFEEEIGQMMEFVNPEIDMAVKREVYEHLQDSVATDPKVTIDFRRFSSMIDLRMAYPEEWKVLCREILYPTK